MVTITKTTVGLKAVAANTGVGDWSGDVRGSGGERTDDLISDGVFK